MEDRRRWRSGAVGGQEEFEDRRRWRSGAVGGKEQLELEVRRSWR